MGKRDHLTRLDRGAYQGDAMVHWTLTMSGRRQGWLTSEFHAHFRELLTHSSFRYALACPIFCLMPDHAHLIWLGLHSGSDQLNAIKHLRTRTNEVLVKIGFELQDQAYDHVYKDDERNESSLRASCNYIARNPERAGLVQLDGYAEYAFTGCLVPGYPELRPFDSDFWNRFDRIVSFLREDGLLRIQP